MKCIRCGHDSKYPERPNKVCPGCKSQFAFEPRDGDILTDMAFKHALELVSSKGAVRFTTDNLYYEICRKKKRFVAHPVLIVILAIAAGVTAVLGAQLHPGWLFGTAATGIAFVVCLLMRLFPNYLVKISKQEFNPLLERWCAVHGTPEGLILRKPQAKHPQPVEADLGDYSFDRAVICDREVTVDLLLANKFHFENNCAVLTLDGYPPGPFEMIRTMLKRNPKLEVFALHDASAKGCQLAHQLATDPAWFDGKMRVIDIGLRPGQAKPFTGLYQEAGAYQPPEGDGLTRAEAEWLAQYKLELAVIRPEQVLKRLYRAVNRKPPDDHSSADGGYVFIWSGGDGGSVMVDGASFSTDATDAEGGVDAFG